jgi:hypothetical protein
MESCAWLLHTWDLKAILILTTANFQLNFISTLEYSSSYNYYESLFTLQNIAFVSRDNSKEICHLVLIIKTEWKRLFGDLGLNMKIILKLFSKRESAMT